MVTDTATRTAATRRWFTAGVLGLPAVVLAGVGLVHPHYLGTETAAQWWQVHVVLLPLFPLLAVVLWVLLRGERGLVAGAARVAAYGYAVFYTALDALAGIAAGYVVQTVGRPDQSSIDLRSLGNELGTIGAYAFVGACVLAVVVLVRRHGQAALPGGVALIAGSVPFAMGHVYWPVGGIGLLGVAAGCALLAALRPTADRPRPSEDRFSEPTID